MRHPESLPGIYLQANTTDAPRVGIHTGDFSGRGFDVILTIINSNAARYNAAAEEVGPTELAERKAGLISRIDQFKAFVADASNYPENVAKLITGRYVEADKQVEGKSPKERIRQRLDQFPSHHIVSDLDGTITESATRYLNYIPGSEVAEPILKKRGRPSFPDVFVTTWQPYLEQAPDLFEIAGSKATVRPGVNKFFQQAAEADVRVTILSANFLPFVEGVMKKTPGANHAEVYAVSADNIISTEKGVLLEHIAKTNPDQAVIYIGDGESDAPAMQAKDYVACYFALEGSKFAAMLEEANLPFLAYRDFNDIAVQLKSLEWPK